MQSYLGIDAGGSGSRWALIDECGSVVAEGADGPSIQVAECGIEESADRVVGVLAAIAARHPEGADAPVVVGLAGIAAGSGAEDLTRALRARVPDRRIRMAEDTVSGAAAALGDGSGVALFAGTGSFAIARGPDGCLRRVGGRGSIASDLGSGYRLAVDAAARALRALDGMAPPTALGASLVAAFEIKQLEDLGLALKQASTKSIAAAAPAVLRCAGEGDVGAIEVVRRAAADLADLARGAAVRGGLELSNSPVVLGGGTMRSETYRAATVDACRALGFRHVTGASISAAVGAARLSRAAERVELPLAGWLDG